MRSLRITATASRDLDEICDYFLERSVDAGDRFVRTFNKKCKHLATFPSVGKLYPHLRPGLRGLLLMDYIIFYRVVDNDVEILRVVSGYQDLQEVFQED